MSKLAGYLPVVYRAADESSLRAQDEFLRGTSLRLAAILGAALFGSIVWRSDTASVDWAGVAAAVLFSGALLAEIHLLTRKPERTWYEGRAAAESVKTLTWRYMVGASPFEIGRPSAEIDAVFLQRLNDVLGVLKELDLVADAAVGEQITTRMRQARSESLAGRKGLYETHRVKEQQAWYVDKAAWNRKRAAVWGMSMLVVEAAGIVAATLKATGTVSLDLLGVAGATVAAMAAWLQTKQHRTLATAYAVTAIELASVLSRIQAQRTEADWAAFASDAEEAFSREHTLWKASRAVRGR